MKQISFVLAAVAALSAVVWFVTGNTHTSAEKTCRTDAQRYAGENASFEAEFDTQFGATTVGQLSISDLLERDTELIGCIDTDPSNREQYKAVLYRDGFIEDNRFAAYLHDTNQMQDFAKWERGQQASQLAKYHESRP